MCMRVLKFMCNRKAQEGKLRPLISGPTASYWCFHTFLQELLPPGRQSMRTTWHVPIRPLPLLLLSCTLSPRGNVIRAVAPTVSLPPTQLRLSKEVGWGPLSREHHSDKRGKGSEGRGTPGTYEGCFYSSLRMEKRSLQEGLDQASSAVFLALVKRCFPALVTDLEALCHP